MSVFIDLSEFFIEPRRTGIQRVCGFICRHWPGPADLVPVRLAESGGLVRLRPSALDAVVDYFNADPGRLADAELGLRQLADDIGAGILPLGKHDRILVPEVFFRQPRLAFYASLDSSVRRQTRFLVYDLLPLTNPECFDLGTGVTAEMYYYFRMLRDYQNVAFISDQTQRDFCDRFLLRPGYNPGPAIRLGSDTFGPRPQFSFRPENRKFVCIGTIEPRKGHSVVLAAFQTLFERVPRLELVFAGRMGWVDAATATCMRSCECARFRIEEKLDDSAMRSMILEARATVFISSSEGFGLPPVESLWCGVPVIASAGIPSLKVSGSAGVEIVCPASPENVRRAVVDLLDDRRYARKAREALNLDLPTWASFAQAVADWVH